MNPASLFRYNTGCRSRAKMLDGSCTITFVFSPTLRTISTRPTFYSPLSYNHTSTGIFEID